MKKVLVVELYHHPKVLENIYHLLNSRCDLTFMINKDKQNSYNKLFPSHKIANVIINKFHSSTLFIWIFLSGWKYDFINISTGPEGSHYSEFANVIFFYLCCFFYRSKIILTVKHLRPYFSSTPGFFSAIRSRAIKRIKRFTFETRSLLDAFKRHATVGPSLMSVQYDRYIDLLPQRIKEMDKEYQSDNNKIKVGLLGVIRFERRDYKTVEHVLSKMNSEERSNIEFVTLGACNGGDKNPVVQALTRWVNVDWIEGIISEVEFQERGIKCDVLLSPMVKEMEYGTFMGSGSFGDAIYLGKKLIMPHHVDEHREFSPMAHYYQGESDLLGIFKRLPELGREKIIEEYRAMFSTENVFKNLAKDLKLSEG